MSTSQRAKSKAAGRQPVAFHCAAPAGLFVGVAGTFNQWNPRRGRMRAAGPSGAYSLVLSLPPGRHEYKFVIGDEWHTDPQNPDTIRNTYGSLNNIVTVS